MSFVYLGIYWNNHHHMIYTVDKATGGILWANLHLLFWLSLIPLASGWMGENLPAQLPTAFYGIILLMAAVAYFILQTVIIRAQGRQSILARAVGRDAKGKASVLLYATAIAMSWVQPWIAIALYMVVAMLWLVPDRRIERILSTSDM